MASPAGFAIISDSARKVADELAREFLEWMLNAPPQELSEPLMASRLAGVVEHAYHLGFAEGCNVESLNGMVAATAPETGAGSGLAEVVPAKSRPPLYRLPCSVCGAYYSEEACPVCAHRAQGRRCG
jgi:hypothetical protein